VSPRSIKPMIPNRYAGVYGAASTNGHHDCRLGQECRTIAAMSWLEIARSAAIRAGARFWKPVSPTQRSARAALISKSRACRYPGHGQVMGLCLRVFAGLSSSPRRYRPRGRGRVQDHHPPVKDRPGRPRRDDRHCARRHDLPREGRQGVAAGGRGEPGRYRTAFMRPRESASWDSIYQLKGARWSTCSMVTFDSRIRFSNPSF
jgi:hypothetical protein